jgi:hypothetical protein
MGRVSPWDQAVSSPPKGCFRGTARPTAGGTDDIVVEFPAGTSNFSGEMVTELARLVDNDLIKVLDLLVLHKDPDGSVEAFEIDDLDEVDELTAIESSSRSSSPRKTSSISLRRWTPAVPPGSSSGRTRGPHRSRPLLVAPAASSSPTAASRSKPSSPRSRPTRKKETDMPLRPARAARRGVIGRPVARTADDGGSAAVVSQGVNRRQNRRQDRRDRR